MIMDLCDKVSLLLPKMQNHKSLSLHGRSFSSRRREGIAIAFAYKGSQSFLYDCMQPIIHQMTQDARPKTIDAPLTLIF